MNRERWPEVKSLFEQALRYSPEARSALLGERCGGDEELRREVESLLAAHDEEFLERPFASDEKMAEWLPPPEALPPGTRVGAYEIVRELGRGGMGAVYLAARADREFQKSVAIKLIRRDMQTALTVRRFRNERQILATLEHPNIARLIDGGTTPDGLPYFVMEYVEGEPLLQYCEARSLPVRERLDLFVKICCAVYHAHRRMIIHRDLKPGNILVQSNGTPKLLDFGIAKLLDPESEEAEEITLTGMRALTPAYASPEQKRGDAATFRSDIYSLGVILMELVTGRRPRPAEQTGPAEDTDQSDVVRIASRATREAPEERYETVGAMSADVEAYLAGSGVPQYDYASARPRGDGWKPVTTVSLAVLPLRLLNPDSEPDAYLGIGIADAVITKLSNVARIAVRPTGTVMRYAQCDNPLEAGKEMGVDFVLEGRIQKSGSRVRVTVQLVRVQSGAPVWATLFDEEFRDLLKLEDSISGQVAGALTPQLTSEERERLARQGTANSKAHEAYLRGRWQWNAHTEEGRAKALVSFMEALAEDPRYARAHAGVADYYLQLAVWGGLPPAESFAAAKESARKALEIDSSLAEAHASFAFVSWAYDRDAELAAHHFQMAIALNPDYTQAHHWFGLFHLAQGRPEIALASIERARKLEPHSPIMGTSVGFCLYHARKFDRAIEEVRNAIRLVGEDGRLQELLAWCYLARGMVTESLVAARRAVEISHRNAFTVCALARAEAAAGNRAAALDLVGELARRAETQYLSATVRGCANLALDGRDEALRLLEQAWRDYDWWAYFTGTSQAWDSLRGLPRFQQSVEAHCLGHPPKGAAQPRRVIAAPADRWKTGAAIALILLCAIAGFVVLRSGSHAPPFQNTRMARITTNGTAARAVISPDGAHVAYVANLGGKPALWVRKTDTPESRLLAGPADSDIIWLNFTSNGNQVCYVTASRREPAHGALYTVPVTGGASSLLMADLPGPAAPSVNGSRLAFLRRNPAERTEDLYVANLDGTAARKVATRRYPERFAWDSVPAWSADGRRLAIGVEGTDNTGFYVYLMIVDVAGGSAHILRTPRWQYVERIAWLDRAGANGLAVIGQEAESSFQHIWYIPYPKGAAKRINSDLSDYIGVSLTADGKTLVSVQTQTLANVYVRGGDARDGTQVTSGEGRYFDLSWAPDGKIVYASDASGSADIWMMNADGSGQMQLTSHSGRNYAPVVSPDGNWVVFHSNRSGSWNIWRTGVNGVDPRALTADSHDSNWPRFGPDGRFVFYHHTGTAGWNIWKVPLAGGPPIQLTNSPSTHPAISPRDGRIACWYSRDFAKPSWKLAVLPAEGGAPDLIFDPPGSAVADATLAWTPSGNGITYLDGRGGVSNLWTQPAAGGPPHALTSFTSGQIYSFDWSRDGRLVYSRGISTSDVVLIHDLN